MQTTELIPRGSPYPEIGVNGAVDAIAFNLKKGETSAPIPTDNAVVVAQVADKQDIDQAKMLTDRGNTRDQLLNQKRQEFFTAYMAKARQKMKTSFNEAAIRAILVGNLYT